MEAREGANAHDVHWLQPRAPTECLTGVPSTIACTPRPPPSSLGLQMNLGSTPCTLAPCFRGGSFAIPATRLNPCPPCGLGQPCLPHLPTSKAFNDGHQMAAHSQTHRNFQQLTAAEVREEMAQAEKEIVAAIGKAPRHFRYPFGAYNTVAAAEVHNAGYIAVGWNLVSADHASLNGPKILNTVHSALAGANPRRDLVLAHDTVLQTQQVLKQIIAGARGQGFKLVTTAECLGEAAYKGQSCGHCTHEHGLVQNITA